MSIEDPDTDRYEQQLPASYDEADDEDYPGPADVPLDADPRDVADQHRSVPLDDELDG
ncbi:MAG TPA: hypothetical protein VGJ13_12265 [Pseudonocardiaceae bacterium]|jgi:hypothetical protein